MVTVSSPGAHSAGGALAVLIVSLSLASFQSELADDTLGIDDEATSSHTRSMWAQVCAG